MLNITSFTNRELLVQDSWVSSMKNIILAILLVVSINQVLSQKYIVEEIKTDLRGDVFAPTYSKNFLVACSNQKDRVAKTILDKHGQEPVDLYVIDPFKADSSFRFDEKFRTVYHDGPICFDGPGNVFCVSRNLVTDQKYKNLKQADNHLGLYFSSYNGKEWSELTEFPFNDTSYVCSHPTLNYDGNELIFSSNMPGGQGGFDLWKSKLVNEQWSKPVNLGPTINTIHNEVFPYVHGLMIYFSSDRGEFGGLDIYQSGLFMDYKETEVLPAEINTAQDDFGLITSNGLESGFFSSNRGGKDKLYSFYFEYPVFENCDSLVKTYTCYEFSEQNYYETDEVQSIVYQWRINEDTVKGVAIDYCFPGAGDYEIFLDVIDTIINITYFEQSYYYLNIAYEQQPYITAADTVQVNKYFQATAESTNLPGASIKEDDYYWVINGKNYRGYSAVHKFDLPGIYEIQLGVIGQKENDAFSDCVYRTIVCVNENGVIPEEIVRKEVTPVTALKSKPKDLELFIYTIELGDKSDSKGTDNYDFSLIDPENKYDLNIIEENDEIYTYYGTYSDSLEAYKMLYRLIENGYENAELKKIALNELDKFDLTIDEFFEKYNDIKEENPSFFDETSDNIKIEDIKHFYVDPSDSAMTIFSVEVARSDTLLNGDHRIFKLIPPFGEYFIKYIEEDSQYIYLFGSFKEFDEGHKFFKELQQLGIEGSILRSFNTSDFLDFDLNETFVFNNIQFDSDKWAIRSDSEVELQKIIDVMSFFPELKIDISAHTDATASNQYNLGLSQKRAKSVREFLISNGIIKERITYKGYGEEKPIDSNETEEGKQNNRRVEFTISKG